jgi:hypothetical protein
MHAGYGDIVHFYLGHGTPDMLGQPHPELAGIRLGLGIRSPVVAHMLIFAGNLTTVAAVTNSDIDNKNLHLLHTSFDPGVKT